jgi:hypothetical protein
VVRGETAEGEVGEDVGVVSLAEIQCQGDSGLQQMMILSLKVFTPLPLLLSDVPHLGIVCFLDFWKKPVYGAITLYLSSKCNGRINQLVKFKCDNSVSIRYQI